MEGNSLMRFLYPVSWRDLPLVYVPPATSFYDLPVCLITDILSRLPVKSIIRSTAVNTTWYLFFRKPKFIALHLRRSIQNGNKYLLVTSSSSNSCSLISEKTYTEETRFEIPFHAKSGLVSSCNGLICIGDAREFHLWNPSVNKYRHIHSSCYDDLLNDPPNAYSVIGFGYHDDEDDYRIVRVFFGSDNPRVELYSLETDTWRKLECNVPRVLNHKACVFADGFIYWLDLKKDNSVEWIVSFDLKKEVFEEFMLPRNLSRSRAEKVSIMKFKGLVSICCSHAANDGQNRYSVWILKRDSNGSVSWIEQFRTVSKVVGLPMMFTSCGKLVLQTLTNLTLFDLEKKKFMLIGSDGPYTGGDNSFVETLALFGEDSCSDIN